MANARATEEVQRLFLRHSGLLRGFVLALVPDPGAAEDLFQEIFLTLTRKAEDFRPGTDFLAWARAVARLKVLEHVHRATRVPHALDPATIESLIASSPVLDDTWGRRRKALEECLQKVSPKSREILELRYSAGLLPGQIARRIAWTAGAVHVGLARTRKFLRDCTRRGLGLKEA
jgi:RNA polymerase sigma-70 factor (ECF subfamily)